MKILSITSTLPQYDAQWVRISHIVRLLEKNGIEVELINYVIKGFENYKLFKQGNFKGNFLVNDPITILFKHLNILKQGNYDLVYGNTFIATFFCIVGKLIRKPLILDLHGISEEYAFLGKSRIYCFFMEKMEMIAILFSDKILCVSNEMIDYLHKEKGVPMNKLFYVPNGVDLDFFKQIGENQVNEMRKKYNLENKLIFGYLGGTHKWQGFENFILASKAINDDRFASLIVGCDIPKCIQKDNITYIPFVNKNEIVNFYSLCDVLVIPRPKHIVTDVAAPTKFAEYASMAKPILITDVGDAAKLVKKNKNGLVVKNNNLENIKKGINQFLFMNKDKMIKMGENSRKLAENEFNWDKIIISLIKILNL